MKVSQLLLISALIVGLPIASQAAEIPVAPVVDAIATMPVNTKLTNSMVKRVDTGLAKHTVHLH